MFLAGGTTCEGLLSCCLVKPSKLFILGSFQLLWVIYTGLLPVVAYCHPKSQQIRVSQLILNLAIRFFLKSVGSPRDLIYSSVSVFSIQTDQFYPIILLSPTVDSWGYRKLFNLGLCSRVCIYYAEESGVDFST